MSNNARKVSKEIHAVTEGLADVPVVELPPHIKWGDKFKSWDTEKKISFLIKFSEAMNHAADVIQKERDVLGKLVEKKEAMLINIQGQLEANNKMVQSEVMKMNEYKQQSNATIAKLNARIRELECGT